MRTIPDGHSNEPSLQQLRVLGTLLHEHNLTRAARELGVAQPAVSKTLAQLRRHFDDPLLVRVGRRMELTPRARQLQASVRAVLDSAALLRSESVTFAPRTSHRTFNFCVVDAGLLKLLPPLVERLLTEAPNVRLRVLQPEAPHLERWLESGKLDFAMGSFPSMPKGIRRQRLWVERYVSVVRSGHPRLPPVPTMRAFAAEKHVLVSIAGSGHAHQVMQKALEAVIPRENVVCQVPIFIGAAVLAKHSARFKSWRPATWICTSTSTPAGKLMFQVTGAFAEFERSMIRQRVNAGLKRAVEAGKTLGRPRVSAAVEKRVQAQLRTGKGILKVAREVGVGTGTVQRIKQEMTGPFAVAAA
jgi:DNA-binding transcriptional LysR family regulator